MEIQDRNHIFPKSYAQKLNLRETEAAIKFIKDTFQKKLAEALNLTRVSAPVFVSSGTGINDHLSGVEKPVCFTIRHTGEQAEVVQSLAKWKRKALADYGFACGEGLYTDMNAIRPDEQLDNLHSVYVDQWDWERILRSEDRNTGTLKDIVRTIYRVVRETERLVCERYTVLGGPVLPEDVHFVHSEDLETAYPDMTPKEREQQITREKGAVFVIGLGWPLRNGCPHDARAADYDDWSSETGEGKRGLNGDILVWYPVLNCSLELSSMGIRVDRDSIIIRN
jgi:aspartate--ammonia ligase